MKITTNEFGNYSARIQKPAVQHNKPAEAPKQAEATKQKLGSLSNEEKNFFAKLYPENKSDVMNYHFYQKTGKMQRVSLGTLFDKRG